MEEIKILKLNELKEFKNHPFKVIRNGAKDKGVMEYSNDSENAVVVIASDSY